MGKGRRFNKKYIYCDQLLWYTGLLHASFSKIINKMFLQHHDKYCWQIMVYSDAVLHHSMTVPVPGGIPEHQVGLM